MPAKNIVICCDGTGNEFVQTHDEQTKAANSNVVKLYTALKINDEQVGYYHPGVGTMGGPQARGGFERLVSRIGGLALAAGFMDQVEDAYRYLMETYTDGDRIFLIGFSRGSYTVRALAAILHGYGLLCKGNQGQIPYLLTLFERDMSDARKEGEQRRKDKTSAKKTQLNVNQSFKETFCHAYPITLHFVGIWDTVSSVGWISQPLRLLYSAQNPIIRTGRHAVAIDERRCFYQDNLWGDALLPPETPTLGETSELPDGTTVFDPIAQDMLQVWFAGAHSDVGGSYVQQEGALANGTLRWLLDEAKTAGLKIEADRESLIFGLPTEKVYAAAPMYFTPPEPAIVHPSLSGPWWILEVLPHRYYVMDIDEEHWRFPFGASRTLPRDSVIHPSVFERMNNEAAKYAPRNVPLGELKPHPGTQPGTTADLHGFYRYEPPIQDQAAPAGLLKTSVKVLTGAVLLLSTVALLLRGRSS